MAIYVEILPGRPDAHRPRPLANRQEYFRLSEVVNEMRERLKINPSAIAYVYSKVYAEAPVFTIVGDSRDRPHLIQE